MKERLNSLNDYVQSFKYGLEHIFHCKMKEVKTSNEVQPL